MKFCLYLMRRHAGVVSPHTARQIDQSKLQLCSCKPAHFKCLIICDFGLAELCCKIAEGNFKAFTHHFIANSEHLSFTLAC